MMLLNVHIIQLCDFRDNKGTLLVSVVSGEKLFTVAINIVNLAKKITIKCMRFTCGVPQGSLLGLIFLICTKL